MRDRQHIASLDALEALLGQLVPQFDVRGRFDVGDRVLGHPVVAENDVAVVVVALRRARMFVTHEGGEAAGRGPVVRLFGHVAGALPQGTRGLKTVRAAFAANIRHALGVLADDYANERRQPFSAFAAQEPARVDVVHLAVFIKTELHLAEELGVIGDRREIQRTLKLLSHEHAAVLGIGRDRNGLSFGEAIRVGRSSSRAERTGVIREGRMDVQVAEIRVAVGVAVHADLPVLGVCHQACAELRLPGPQGFGRHCLLRQPA